MAFRVPPQRNATPGRSLQIYHQHMLTPAQQQEIITAASSGIALDTAARYAGFQTDAVYDSLTSDWRFARDLTRTMVGLEIWHMNNVKQAAKDPKHWRASVWWLEQMAPELYKRSSDRTISAADVRKLIERLIVTVNQEVQHPDSDRLRLRLGAIIRELEALDPPRWNSEEQAEQDHEAPDNTATEDDA